MQSTPEQIVILGTGGTIAGTAADPADHVGYLAAQLSVDELIRRVPALEYVSMVRQQVAQIDSKDMSFAVWHALARAVEQAVARPKVAGVVITHGTDTLEETAYFLARVLAPDKPVVLTAAMRPATALSADGPQNLADAVAVARHPSARGVLVVLAGQVHSGLDVRKIHPTRVDAFGSGDSGPLGVVEQGQWVRWRDLRHQAALGMDRLPVTPEHWPWVEILTSHAGATGAAVQALTAAGVAGLVVAGTGNATLHQAMEAALLVAQSQGVVVWRSTRCGDGRVIDDGASNFPSTGALTPVQARVELMLFLLGR